MENDSANEELKNQVEADKKLKENMNKLLDELDRHFKLEKKMKELTLEELEGEVKEWGNSAHIPVSKKFTGRMATIRILKNEEEQNEKNN